MESKFATTTVSIHDQPAQNKFAHAKKHPVQQMLDNVR